MVLLRSYSTFSDGGCGGKCCALFVSITFGIITCIVLVPGLILLPLGISKKAAAGSLNPGVDFTSLGNNCRIVDIQVKQETERTERTEYNRRIIEDTCNHIYTYIFVYVGNDTAVRKDVEFESRDEEKREVSKGRCPPVEARPLQAAMSEGKLYECWKPTRPGQQAGEYRCADDDCIKLFSPAKEVSGAVRKANDLLNAGIALLVIGLLLLATTAAIIYCCFCRNRIPNNLSSPSGSGHGYPTPYYRPNGPPVYNPHAPQAPYPAPYGHGHYAQPGSHYPPPSSYPAPQNLHQMNGGAVSGYAVNPPQANPPLPGYTHNMQMTNLPPYQGHH